MSCTPAASSSSTTSRPTLPVAPVTRIVMRPPLFAGSRASYENYRRMVYEISRGRHVATERRGDPQRQLALLWRRHRPVPQRPAGPGRPPLLSVDALVSAAMELADGHGLAGVTMGRVAAALGVGTMTLYSYVRSKAELVDLMVDEALT